MSKMLKAMAVVVVVVVIVLLFRVLVVAGYARKWRNAYSTSSDGGGDPAGSRQIRA